MGIFFPAVNQLIQANTENAVEIELPRIWFYIRQNKNSNTLCHLGWIFDYEYINNLFGKYFPSLQLLSVTQMLLVLSVCVCFFSTVLFVGFSIQLLRICRVISMFFFLPSSIAVLNNNHRNRIQWNLDSLNKTVR